MRKSKGNSGEICGKSARQLMEDFSLQEVFRDGAVILFFLAGKQHNEPFSWEISR
jgi:hypothetical protein